MWKFQKFLQPFYPFVTTILNLIISICPEHHCTNGDKNNIDQFMAFIMMPGVLNVINKRFKCSINKQNA